MHTYLTSALPRTGNQVNQKWPLRKWVLLNRMLVSTFILLFVSFSYGQNLPISGDIAPVVNPSGGFHIDGDLISNSPTAGVGDWVPGSAGSGGSIFSAAGVSIDPAHSFLLTDPYNVNNDNVFSGSSMNEDPNVWKWAYSSTPAKNEINRGMIHLSEDADGEVWIMMGADRLSTNGTAYIDFELLQNTMTLNSSTFRFNSAGPDGGRTINDILITVNYNNGGGVSSIFYYSWQNVGGTFQYVTMSPGLSGLAVTNGSPVSVPFGAFGSTTYSKYQFVEAAVNINQLVQMGSSDPCAGMNIKTIFVKTKASTSTTAELKDFIAPLQVNFGVGEVSLDPVGPLCLNSSPVTLVGTPAGGTFSGPGVSGSSFNPSVAGIGVHRIIYEKQLLNNCLKKDTIYITVETSIGGAVSGATTVCSGSNSGTLTLSGQTGNVIKWQQSTDVGNTYADIANTSTTLNFSNITQSTKYRAVVQQGSCSPANSAPATVTVDPASVGGSVAGGRSVCYGSNSGTVTLSGQTGNVVKWQKSTDGGTTYTDIANTTTSLSYSNLTVTTRFRAVVQSGVCASANSNPAIITIDPISEGGSLAGSTHVCAGSNSGTITLSGNVGTVVKWQQSTNNGGSFSDISGTSGLTSYTFSNLSETTIFRAVVQSGSCSPANSQTATITVDPATDPGTIIGSVMICDNNSSSVLTLTGYTGTIIKWQSSTDGITFVDIANTTNTLAIGLLTQRTYYRVQVRSGLCSALYSPTFTVRVMSCGPTTNHCTYTQGFYGNVGGLGCDGGTPAGSLETAKTKMLKAFDIYGQLKVVFGRTDIGGIATNDRAFTLFKEDVNNGNIFKMLPGGGTASILGLKPGGTAYTLSFDGATYSDLSTWNAVPISTSATTYGKIKNSLLAQTMTLFFNMNNGTNLASQSLHDTLYVQKTNCDSGTIDTSAAVLQFGLPHEVLTYMVSNSSTYTKDVAGLYKLANDVLGGVTTPGLSGLKVIDAVDKINNAFDGCRTLISTFDLPMSTGALVAIPYIEMQRINAEKALQVQSYPNPYRDRVSFSIRSAESGYGVLELYNLAGQKLQTVFAGQVIAGSSRVIDYVVPENERGTILYTFRIGEKRVSGKLISPRK